MVKILIVEGNVKALRELTEINGALTQGELYKNTLNSLADDLNCSIVCPSDEDAVLPMGNSLADYDGIVWTGSALNIYDDDVAITRQVDFMKACFDEETKMFGSCWGLQVAVVATGGEIAANDKGRQIGIARDIDLTDAGRTHPLYKGKPPVFDAINIHLDHTTRLPEGAIVLSRNEQSEVQGVEIKRGRSVFWGVQYHPEFDLGYMSGLIRRYEKKLIDEGISKDKADVEQWAADWAKAENEAAGSKVTEKYALTCDVLDAEERLRELSNWLDFLREQKADCGQRKKISHG